MPEHVPTLYEWAGGDDEFARLTEEQRSRWVALIAPGEAPPYTGS